MKALIAEDEIHLAEDLRRRLSLLWPELEIAAVVHDGEAAADALSRIAPDIAFLDIRMPGMGGLDAARFAPSACRVVFVTAYGDHAVAAFEQAAADYLLKPVSEERLARAVARLKCRDAPELLLSKLQQLLARKEEPLRLLRAQVGQEVRLIDVGEVCYLQSLDKYTAVFTRESELLLRTPLRELSTRLDPGEFWQVHRGIVVNARQVIAAHHDPSGKITLTLRDRPEKIAVSRSHAYLFRQM